MTSAQNIHIDIRRGRIKIISFSYLVAALAVLFGFFYMATGLEDGWALTLRISGGLIALLLVFLSSGVMQLLKKKDAGLFLDAKGITDNSTAISGGLIEWKAIDKIEVNERGKMVLVFVKNPEVFVKNAKNSAVRQLLQRNIQIYKTPFIIEPKYLNTDFNGLRENVTVFAKKFANRR